MSCEKGRLEKASVSDILYVFGQEYYILIRENLGNSLLKSDIYTRQACTLYSYLHSGTLPYAPHPKKYHLT